MLPSPDILNEYPYGKFVLSNLAAKRAKQLKEGAPPLVQVDSIHPLTIALAEIAAGKIKPILNRNEALDVPEIPTLMVDDTLPPELGMLLPALDETEAALISSVEAEGDDLDHEGEDLISLSDLVDEDEDADEDAAAASGDDDTLSLTDIAEAESIEEEGEEE
jgi:DNA-directed RNA polymerase subunit omega